MSPRVPSGATRQVVVLGAGIGGLSAALRLRAAGLEVTVLEKEPTVGGKMGRLQEGGYTWDTGPSVITMRDVLEDLFAIAGQRLEDHVELLPLEPTTRYFHADGSILDVHTGEQPLRFQQGSLEPGEQEDYQEFLRHAAQLYRITAPSFIHGDPPGLRSLLSVPPTDLLRIDGLRSMDRSIRARVRSPRLRQLLGRFATYVGANPFRAPATLNVIAEVELGQGVWYPRGGIHRIAEALGALCQQQGVQILTRVAVDSIEVRGGQVRGVRGLDGVPYTADAVIANADVTTVYERLLPRSIATPARRRRLTRVEPSTSALVYHWGVRGQSPGLVHHNLFFSRDSKTEFAELDSGQVPTDPTIYVAITSKTDPQHAPEGCENWFVLVNAPPLEARTHQSASSEGLRQRVLQRLREQGLDLEGRIEVEHTASPLDFADRSASWRGALYGPSSNSRWTAFARPHNRCRHVRGLYFAGGSTHPGGGVPMVALSGKVAARLLLRDLGMREEAQRVAGVSEATRAARGR